MGHAETLKKRVGASKGGEGARGNALGRWQVPAGTRGYPQVPAGTRVYRLICARARPPTALRVPRPFPHPLLFIPFDEYTHLFQKTVQMKNAGVHGVQFGAALSDHAEPHLIDFDADPMVGISPIQGSAYARSKGASPSFENQYAAAVGIVYIVIAVIVIRRLEQVGIVVLVLFWLLLLLLLLLFLLRRSRRHALWRRLLLVALLLVGGGRGRFSAGFGRGRRLPRRASAPR
jgi:hypothetical protein